MSARYRSRIGSIHSRASVTRDVTQGMGDQFISFGLTTQGKLRTSRCGLTRRPYDPDQPHIRQPCFTLLHGINNSTEMCDGKTDTTTARDEEGRVVVCERVDSSVGTLEEDGKFLRCLTVGYLVVEPLGET